MARLSNNSQFCDDLDLKFDKVLLDAPCSGNYALETGWFSKRDLEGVKSNARLQKKLLRAGIKVLKKSGILVYSTCSLEVEENENVIEWALENLSVKLVAIKGFGSEASSQNKEVRKCRRLWPHLDGSGYFMAKFVKM